MKEIKLQWHPTFVVAMDLEFERNRADLIFEKGSIEKSAPMCQWMLFFMNARLKSR